MSRNQAFNNQRGRSSQFNQISMQRRDDPFRQMNSIMQSFGSFGGNNFFQDDFFKGSLMNRFQSPFDSMMNFSDMHKNVHKNGREGSYVCQTFVSSSTMGSDGKINKESYYENSSGQHKGNQTISQKQQAYKNNNGVNRIAQQRMLNNKGHKIVKQKKGSQIQETNHYYNMDQDQRQSFHNSWGRSNQQLGFLQNHQKYMRGIQNTNHQQRQLGLEYEPNYRKERNDRKYENNQPKRLDQRVNQEALRGQKTRQSGRNYDQYSTQGSQKSGYSSNSFKKNGKY